MENEFILVVRVLPGSVRTALARAHNASGAAHATKGET